MLLNQIKAKAYERSLAEGKTHNFPAVLPEYLAEQAEEASRLLAARESRSGSTAGSTPVRHQASSSPNC